MTCYPGCPDCGLKDSHFDRSLCACGAMHQCCNGCGRADGCPLNSCVAAPQSERADSSEGAATLSWKLLQHDEFAGAAVRYLIDWLRQDPEALLAMARGRHAEGHYRYGDRLMFEHSQDTLVAEAAQELADAICYIALKLQRDARP